MVKLDKELTKLEWMAGCVTRGGSTQAPNLIVEKAREILQEAQVTADTLSDLRRVAKAASRFVSLAYTSPKSSTEFIGAELALSQALIAAGYPAEPYN